MKQTYFLALNFILIICLHSSSCLKASHAVKFVSHFLKAMGVTDKFKYIAKKVISKCPNLRRSSMLINIINRVNRIKKGIRRLKNKAIGLGINKKRKVKLVGQRAMVQLVRDIVKRLNHCKVAPKELRDDLRYSIKLMNKVVSGKCRGKICKLFSARKMGKLTNVIQNVGNKSKRSNIIHKFNKIHKKRRNFLSEIAKIIAKLLKKLFKLKKFDWKKEVEIKRQKEITKQKEIEKRYDKKNPIVKIII